MEIIVKQKRSSSNKSVGYNEVCKCVLVVETMSQDIVRQFFISTKLSQLTQPIFICSKSTMQTPVQCVNFVQSLNKDTRTTSMTSSWCH